MQQISILLYLIVPGAAALIVIFWTVASLIVLDGRLKAKGAESLGALNAFGMNMGAIMRRLYREPPTGDAKVDKLVSLTRVLLPLGVLLVIATAASMVLAAGAAQ